MKHLVIVYHSATGGTRQMAEAVARGAGAAGRLMTAAEAGPEDILAAAGYVFAAPENLAAISGVMKDFFDRCYYPVLERLNGRAYAILVCAGSDGTNAVRQMERIATGWRLRAVAAPMIVNTHAQAPADILAPKVIGAAELARCEELGAAMAEGIKLGIF